MALHVSYGPKVPHDGELRLCGDVRGKRVIELGISPEVNALALAHMGAKSIAVDTDPARIAAARQSAKDEGVHVEFHGGDLADLGFATSASVDLVIGVDSLDAVDDLARVLRQVHRVLKPEAPFVATLTHPVASMLDGAEVTLRRPYGQAPSRTMAELFMSFQRANFRVDVLQELYPVGQLNAMVPSVLLIRARKLGV